jgi:hypothetical protein
VRTTSAGGLIALAVLGLAWGLFADNVWLHLCNGVPIF